MVCVAWIRSHYLLSLGFVLVGGFSNVIDRIAYGGVIDYLPIGNIVLNLADISIWTGCVMILFYRDYHVFFKSNNRTDPPRADGAGLS